MSHEYLVKGANETYIEEGSYTTEFLKWKGHVDRNPILRAIMNANADAVTASWRTFGKHGEKTAEILDDMRGTGKETFKTIFNNLIKMTKIGGDSYAEIVYDKVKGIKGDVPVDLITLPPDRIAQHIKNGRIKHYEELHTGKKFKPEKIFHLAYNPIGAQTHGSSVIEPMNNILIYMEAILHSGSKIFEKYIKPTTIFFTDTDDPTDITTLKDEWKAVMQTESSDLFVPEDKIKRIERVSIPQYSTLDPAHWHRVLLDHLIMSSRVPELALGTGSVNSEESARMQFMGFRQMVRWDQKFLEESMRAQLFPQIYPENTPTIKWSFAAEQQEERFERYRNTFKDIAGSPMPENIKQLILIKILNEMGLIPDE